MPTWTKIANKRDLPPGKAIAVSIGQKRLAIFNVGGQFYCIDDECTHAGASLAEGELSGHIVTCPWHGATFDVTTGVVLGAPAYENVGGYKVHLEGEDIRVEIL